MACGAIFTTHEEIDLARSIRVKNKESKLEIFSKEKLFYSLALSLSHKENHLHEASSLINTICSALIKTTSDGIVDQEEIEKVTYSTLKRYDNPACVYYKSHFIK